MEFSRPLNSPLIFDSFTLISFYHYVAVAVIRFFYWRSLFNDPVLELRYKFYTLYPDSLLEHCVLAPLLIYIL